MKSKVAIIIAMITLLSLSAVRAQSLFVSPDTVPVGADITLLVTNPTPNFLLLGTNFARHSMRIFNARGEYVNGWDDPLIGALSANATDYFTLTPSDFVFGALPEGHYVAEIHMTSIGLGISSYATRFTVGTPTTPPPGFITVFDYGETLHRNFFLPPTLRVINPTPTDLTLSNAAWALETHSVSAPPVSSGTFNNTDIPAASSVSFPWPGSLSNSSIEELTISWDDPLQGGLSSDVVEASGLAPFGTAMGSNGVQSVPAFCLLHRPMGSTVPQGGSLDLIVQTILDTVAGYAPSNMALVAALGPGEIPLSNGVVLPLASDALLSASLTGQLTSTIWNSPGLTVETVGGYHRGKVGPMRILHPGPFVSGLTVFVAAIGYEPNFPRLQISAAHRLRFE